MVEEKKLDWQRNMEHFLTVSLVEEKRLERVRNDFKNNLFKLMQSYSWINTYGDMLGGISTEAEVIARKKRFFEHMEKARECFVEQINEVSVITQLGK